MTFSKGPVSVVLPGPQDIVGISDVAAIGGIAATTVAIGMLQAAQVRLIVHVNSLRDRDRSVPDELAPELGVARHIAEQRVGLSDALLTRLPAPWPRWKPEPSTFTRPRKSMRRRRRCRTSSAGNSTPNSPPTGRQGSDTDPPRRP